MFGIKQKTGFSRNIFIPEDFDCIDQIIQDYEVQTR